MGKLKMQFRKLRSNKRSLLLFCVVTLLIFSVGVTLAAYFVQYSVKNTFDVGMLDVQVQEEFSPPDKWDPQMPVTKKVSYKNTGTTNALLRVRSAESWVGSDGVTLPNNVNDASLIKKNWNSENGLVGSGKWTEKDGWYYFNFVLKPNETITVLESVEFADPLNVPPEYVDGQYTLVFFHEFIRVDTGDAVNAWGVDENKFSVNADNDQVNWFFSTKASTIGKM